MKRTTIFADDDILIELKQLAQQKGRPVSELVREALKGYVEAQRPARRHFSFIGIGESTGEYDAKYDAASLDEELAKGYEEVYRRQRESFEAYRNEQEHT